jgi:hypothetical protein
MVGGGGGAYRRSDTNPQGGTTVGYAGATVVTWRGRQPGVSAEQGLGVLASALAYYDDLATSGRITGYRVYSSSQSDRGMLIVEGPLDDLVGLGIEATTLKFLAQAHNVVQDVQVEHFAGGSAEDATSFYLAGLQSVQEAGL